jgi:hypothetical protein
MLAQPRILTFPHKFSAGFSSPIVLHLLMHEDTRSLSAGFFHTLKEEEKLLLKKWFRKTKPPAAPATCAPY